MNARVQTVADRLAVAIEDGDSLQVRQIVAAAPLSTAQRVEIVRYLARPRHPAVRPGRVRLAFDRWDRARIVTDEEDGSQSG